MPSTDGSEPSPAECQHVWIWLGNNRTGWWSRCDRCKEEREGMVTDDE